ncbi:MULTISPECIES: hypothetical protein [Flavobacterium]|uniref:Lipoprotein n=1 Tax=Flavobacterium jumunjinense TaxID=998845 RepID=A0ABV5GP93_9FLAO|nr:MULTISPECIES: hypothetical protein [Flavobacterium]
MKKRTSLFVGFLVTLFLINCKQNKKQVEDVSNLNVIESVEKSSLNSCEETLFKVVQSSDLDFRGVKNFFVRVESIEEDEITMQVYFENNLSDNVNQKQIVESTIAWLLFLPNRNELLNITADPENPENLNFKYHVEDDFFKNCNIEKKKITKPSIDCIDLEVEMGSGQECLIKNTTIEVVYKNVILNKELEDVKWFLEQLPKENKTLEIKQNGLNTIDYVIDENAIEVLMYYDGGLTELIIKKMNNDVKKSIIYNAD